MGTTRQHQQWPTRHPTPDEAEWGASIFLEKGGVMPYGPRSALRVHSMDEALLSRLLDIFGGRVHRAGTSRRWMLFGEPLLSFLKHIHPHLSEEGQRRSALLRQVVELEKPSRAFRGEDLLHVRLAQGNGVSAAPSSDANVPAADANVPPGPWSADDPVFTALGPTFTTFRARNDDEAEHFAAAAEGFGMLVELEGRIVRVAAGEAA